jgi:hypothetical protein
MNLTYHVDSRQSGGQEGAKQLSQNQSRGVSKEDQWIIQLNVEPDPIETHKMESNNQLKGDGSSINLAPVM